MKKGEFSMGEGSKSTVEEVSFQTYHIVGVLHTTDITLPLFSTTERHFPLDLAAQHALAAWVIEED